MNLPVETQGTGGHRVRRERLLAKLDRLGDHQVNLVCAPAGFGKSTTVRQWLGGLGETTAWVDLSPDDNDPSVLWSRIIDESIQEVGVGVEAKVALGGIAGSVRPAIEKLAERLAARNAAACLVLDDFHLVDERDCLNSIELAIELLPAQTRLVLISRVEPDLPVSRYEGRRQLLRIGPTDLALDETETKELLLSEQNLEVTPELVEVLWERTEGWPAAVYMTALWLHDHPESSDAQLLPKADERIIDYLLSEVIGSLDPPVRDFLERTSFLNWMSGELCDEVCELSGSAEMLEDICRANRLVERDLKTHGWFRYHALMRDVLLERLKRNDPEQLKKMRRNAIEWFRRHGKIDDAAEISIEAGEFNILADLLETNYFALARNGRGTTIWRWSRALPLEVLDSRPWISLVAALAAETMAVPSIEIRRFLARAERARENSGDEWSEYHESLWQVLRALSAGEGVSASVASARLAVAASADIPEFNLATQALLANYLEMAGEIDEAEQLARLVAEHPDGDIRPFALNFAVGTLALIENNRGHRQAAEIWVDASHDSVRKFGLQDTAMDSRAWMIDAIVAMTNGDLVRAGRSADKALKVTFDESPRKARLLLVVAQVRALRGQVDLAEEALRMADEEIDICPDVGQAIELREEVRRLIDQAESPDATPREPLSNAELRVLPLLEHGSSRTEIAEELFLSVNTVKTHMRSIYRKLNAKDREEAIAKARTSGLL